MKHMEMTISREEFMRLKDVEACLKEAVDLLEDKEYKPDSFTTQPWRMALGMQLSD